MIVAVLGYPLYQLVALSFQKYGLFELIAHKGEWIGLDNYSQIFHDRQFWIGAPAHDRLHRGHGRADDAARAR